MNRKRALKAILPLIPLCLLLLGIAFYTPVEQPALKITSTNIGTAELMDHKAGFDTTVRANFIIQGEAPKIENHVYAGGNVICRKARIVQIRNGIEQPVGTRPPRIAFTFGKVSFVTFGIDKASLPSDDCFLRATLFQQHTYNTPGKVKVYNSPGLLVNIPLRSLRNESRH